MKIGQRALQEARTLGGQALLIGSYKTLGARIAAGVALHCFATAMVIWLGFQFLGLNDCEKGCFRPGFQFCCLANPPSLIVWGLILLSVVLSSRTSTEFFARRDFGVSAAVSALFIVAEVIYLLVLSYSFFEIVLFIVLTFFATFLGFRSSFFHR